MGINKQIGFFFLFLICSNMPPKSRNKSPSRTRRTPIGGSQLATRTHYDRVSEDDDDDYEFYIDLSVNPDNLNRNSKKLLKKSVKKPQEAPLFDEHDRIASFFFRPHTASLLLIVLLLLAYVAMGEHHYARDTVGNVKVGLIASSMVYLFYSLLQARDGLLVRPQRVVLRVVKGMAVLYLLFLVFLLFQNVDDARKVLSLIDSNLGQKLEEKVYAQDCRVYTPDHPNGNFANVMEIVNDEFVVAHLLGWFGKALILRDFWFITVYSVLFEVWELTFAHQLANFHECWWDHIIIDILICNGLGAWLGLQVCQYLEMQDYDWAGIRASRGARRKLVRVAQQLLPASWEHYEWRVLSGWRALFGFIGALGIMSLVELNAFYLKTALWIPPPHPINICRLVLWWAMAIPGMREYYQFLSDENENKLGTMSWLSVACAGVEVLITYKFGVGIWDQAVAPASVKISWTLAITFFFIFFTFYFNFRKNFKKD